ncbi:MULTISPECIES: 4'-phosphopantetheinyl transferase family protein [Priestia]|uniref:4'-phosphopantetheinyl transferase family protein n=1 Tax=Priestia TaxID=2800373 RepID=UPI0005EC22F8|nr:MULTISPECIES: 4'-phosphopantetheinyl transferase superfamily protein [Priestia]KJL02055.1 hypothetical protein N178_25240 [Priestia aryabhattai B8W22]MBX4162372.1 4'-phosphopantetheinyl transferase superfamily protein [Priestia megaterium]MED3897280.1 4'-phosphopantetheinyl transferase superfamily protein [Priestia aryabhattai]
MFEYYKYGENTYKTFTEFHRLDSIDMKDANEIFNEREYEYLEMYRASKRIVEVKKSLYCGKSAIRAFLGLDLSQIKNISLLKGVFGQPVIVNNIGLPISLGISITHTHKTLGILIFDQLHPMGIDIETKTKNDSEFLGTYLTKCERKMIEESKGILSKETLFSAKESLSKVLKTGLTSPLSIYEISEWAVDNNIISFFYKNFVQYKSTVMIMEDEIRSITLPIKSEKIIN